MKSFFYLAKFFVVPVIFLFSAYYFYQATNHLRWIDIQTSLASISIWVVFWMVVFTVVNYLLLTLIDYSVVKQSNNDVIWKKVAIPSLLSYVFSYNFGVVLGGILRVKLLQTLTVSTKSLVSSMSTVYVLFWIGYFVIAGVVFIFSLLNLSLALPSYVPNIKIFGVLLLGVGCFLVFGNYLKLAILKNIFTISPKNYLVFLYALFDWMLAGLIFYLALHTTLPSVPFFSLFSIFLIAQIFALLSTVPAGLGVFEAVSISLLPPELINGSFLAGLLLYRMVYYFFPLGFALFFWGAQTMYTKFHKNTPSVSTLTHFFDTVTPLLASIYVYLLGVVLLLSSFIPNSIDNLPLLPEILPSGFVNISNFTMGIVGVFLLFMALALQQRTWLAYYLTQAGLFMGVIFSFASSFDIERVFILLWLMATLYLTRSKFTKTSAIFGQGMSIRWLSLISAPLICGALLEVFIIEHPTFTKLSLFEIITTPTLLPQTKIYVVVLVILILWSIYKWLQPQAKISPPSDADMKQANLIAVQSDNPSSLLVLLRDKYIYFNNKKTTFIMYGLHDQNAIVLGNPVGGDRDNIKSVLMEFVEFCSQHHLTPTFYEVSEECLSLYIDMGFSSTKLGEEALVDVQNFSLEGKDRKKFRNNLSSFSKKGFFFKVLEGQDRDTILPTLTQISDAWLKLKGGPELGFSLGFFSLDYLKNFPIAVVYDERKQIIAFANILRTNQYKEYSIDLMRYDPEKSQSDAMTFLFLNLISWGKDNNFVHFNLGMAPLAGLYSGAHAPIAYKLGNLVFERSKRFYSFKGLYAYKHKFAPTWRSRYFITPKSYQALVQLHNVRSVIKKAHENGF